MPLIVIKKKEKKESYRKKLDSIKNKGINTGKYCGKVKLPDNPVKIQKKLRNEWQ